MSLTATRPSTLRTPQPARSSISWPWPTSIASTRSSISLIRRRRNGRVPPWRSAWTSCSSSVSSSSSIRMRLRTLSCARAARRTATPLVRLPVVARPSTSHAVSTLHSRVNSPTRPRPAWMCTPCVSPLVSSRASAPSTSRPWSPCGCTRSPWPLAMPSFSRSPRPSPAPR